MPTATLIKQFINDKYKKHSPATKNKLNTIICSLVRIQYQLGKEMLVAQLDHVDKKPVNSIAPDVMKHVRHWSKKYINKQFEKLGESSGDEQAK